MEELKKTVADNTADISEIKQSIRLIVKLIWRKLSVTKSLFAAKYV